MKNLFVTALFLGFGLIGQAQTKPDSVKSAKDYIIENENKRTTPPNIVKPEPKKLKPLDMNGETKATPPPKPKKKCCLFCKKKK